MSASNDWTEYTFLIHGIFVAISVFILIVQFIHVNVNFEMFEKRLAYVIERIESLEEEQSEVHRFLFSPSTKEQVDEAEEEEEAEETEGEIDTLSVGMEELKEE